MKTVVSIYIHEKESYSYSFKDFSGYKEFDSEKEALIFMKENKLPLRTEFKDKKLGLTIYHVIEFSHNQNRTFSESIFNHGRSGYENLYWEKKSEEENKARKKAGFVYHKKYDDMTPADYKGKLSKSLTDEVMEYLSSGGCHGYLGHSWRKLSHDLIIEKIVKKSKFFVDGVEVDKWSVLGTWLTSSDARHWMDSREDETNEEFESAFKSSLSYILGRGYIYSLPEHEGTMGSTNKLSNDFVFEVK